MRPLPRDIYKHKSVQNLGKERYRIIACTDLVDIPIFAGSTSEEAFE
jgi:hypothetical protein